MSSGMKLFSLFGELGIKGAEEAEKQLQDVSKEGKKTKNDLSKSFQEIGTKAGEMGKKMALGLTGVATGAVAMVEGTRELRQDLGKLETAFQTTGHGSETATKTFKTMFSVLGEDDTAIEASNHLAILADNEKELEEYTNILTGVYATFGDSLPLEGLAETMNHTAKLGTVQGNLADALEWSGISVEDFNAQLAELTTEEEREKLIRETLTDLYGEASETYKETNESVMANNEAQAELNLKMAEMAEKIEPLVTKGKIFIAEVLMKLQPAITWIIDNINILAPIILGFMGSLFALNIASKIMAFIPILQTLFTVLSANPIVLIIGAIIAVIALLITYWDEVKAVTINVWNAIVEFMTPIAEWFKVNVIDPIINFFTGLWEGIQAVWDGIVSAVKIAVGLIASALDAFLQLVLLPYTFIWENWGDDIKNIWNNLKEGISKALSAISEKVTEIWTAIMDFITPIVTGIKDTVSTAWNAVKDTTSTIFNGVKETASTAWNAVTTTIGTAVEKVKSSVSEKFNAVKTTVTTIFDGIKTKATTTWDGITTKISNAIGTARDAVKTAIDKIKGFFDFDVGLPSIKLPKFSITPSGWKLGDLLEGSIPKLGITWNAEGAIFKQPTIFNTRAGLQGVGEAGAEAIAPIDKLMGYTRQAVSESNYGLAEKLDVLIDLLGAYLPAMSNRQVVLSTGEVVGALAEPLDRALADLTEDRRRGR